MSTDHNGSARYTRFREILSIVGLHGSGEINGVAWLRCSDPFGEDDPEYKVSPNGEDDPDTDAWYTDDGADVARAILARE